MSESLTKVQVTELRSGQARDWTRLKQVADKSVCDVRITVV